MKVIRCKITDDEYASLKEYTDHWGVISYIMRRAITAYIHERKVEVARLAAIQAGETTETIVGVKDGAAKDHARQTSSVGRRTKKT